MVPMTFVGRFAVLVMICVGVVLIPVQASQVYSQLQARRVTLGKTACTQCTSWSFSLILGYCGDVHSHQASKPSRTQD